MEWTHRGERGDFYNAFAEIAMGGSHLCRDFSLLNYLFEVGMKYSQWILTAKNNQGQLAGFAILRKVGNWRHHNDPTYTSIVVNPPIVKPKSKSKSKAPPPPPKPKSKSKSKAPTAEPTTTVTMTSIAGGRTTSPRKRAPKRIVLELICSVGMGSLLLEEIKRKTKSLGADVLELHAIVPAIGFYRLRGFKVAKAGKCEESAAITKAMNDIPVHLWKDEPKAIKNKKFRRLLLLMKNERATPRRCKGIADCNGDGYIMNYCLASHI